MSVRENISLTIIMFLVFCGLPSFLPAGELPGAFRPLSDGGCRIEFPASSAVDVVNLPPDAPEVFGAGHRGKAVIVRSAHATTVCRLEEPYDDMFRIRVQEPSTGWLEIVPLVTEPADTASGTAGRIVISGLDPSQRFLETELADLSKATLEFQRKNRCFSCHLTLPLAWTATVAEFRCMDTPRPLLASIAAGIVELQQADGSFSFPGHPEYGVVSPTLAAAGALTYLQKFCYDLDVAPALGKAIEFLAAHVSASGCPEFDFSFPPLFIGKPFAARLFLDALESRRASDLERAAPADSQLAGLSAAAERVLNQPLEGLNGELWRHFSISITGGSSDRTIATESLALLQKDVSSSSAERDPELLALCEGVLREYGVRAEAGTIPLPEPGDLERRLWRLYQSLYREPPAR